MALIRGPYGGAQIKGSIGSQTYQTGPYGLIMRSRTIPVNPRTPRQEAVRAQMAQLSGVWTSTLTDSQRVGWANYAVATPLPNRFGDSRNVGGRQMFIRTNLMRFMAGASSFADAPVLPGIPAPPLMEFTIGEADGFEVTEVGPALITGDAFSIFAGVPVNPTRNYYSGPFRLIGQLTAASTFPVSISIDPAPVEGQKYFFRVRFSDALGRVSTDNQYEGLVTA